MVVDGLAGWLGGTERDPSGEKADSVIGLVVGWAICWLSGWSGD